MLYLHTLTEQLNLSDMDLYTPPASTPDPCMCLSYEHRRDSHRDRAVLPSPQANAGAGYE